METLHYYCQSAQFQMLESKSERKEFIYLALQLELQYKLLLDIFNINFNES